MNKLRCISVIVSMIFALDGANGQRYEVVEGRNFWNGGRNSAGLRMDSVTVSYAEIYGKYTGGGLRESYQAQQAWSAGGTTATITHAEKYSLAGSFSFDNTSGRKMTGSMFARPGYYPIDLLEFTPGRKDVQTYAFTGGVSVDVAPNWRLGGGIDFTTQNHAKRKDLRYTNYRLDMKITPAVMYHTGDLALGLAYVFEKNAERVSAQELGDNTELKAFLDKGLMYGIYEAWKTQGLHLNEDGMNGFPIRELNHGISLQAQHGRLFAEVEYLYTTGTAGENKKIWFKFPGHVVDSRLGYRLARGDAHHFLKARIAWRHQVDKENVIRTESNEGVGNINTYAYVRIFERNHLVIEPSYRYYSPVLELTAGFRAARLHQLNSQTYPYAISQKILRCSVYFSGLVHFNRIDISAGISFARGTFTDKIRVLEVETGQEPGDLPAHLDDYYAIRNEYLTAPRLDTEIGFRYNFYRGMYAECSGVYSRGFDISYLHGDARWTGIIKLGYNF